MNEFAINLIEKKYSVNLIEKKYSVNMQGVTFLSELSQNEIDTLNNKIDTKADINHTQNIETITADTYQWAAFTLELFN